MSDYLSTLAARTLRREPACEPRRAQMFEPRRETEGTPFVEESPDRLPHAESFGLPAPGGPEPAAPPAPQRPTVDERVSVSASAPHTEGDEPELRPTPRHAEAREALRPPNTTRPLTNEADAGQTQAPQPSRTRTGPGAPAGAEQTPHGVPHVEPVRESSPPIVARLAETPSPRQEPPSPANVNKATEPSGPRPTPHAPREVTVLPHTPPAARETAADVRAAAPPVMTSPASSARQAPATTTRERAEAVRPEAPASMADESVRERTSAVLPRAAFVPRAERLESDASTAVVDAEVALRPLTSKPSQTAQTSTGSNTGRLERLPGGALLPPHHAPTSAESRPLLAQTPAANVRAGARVESSQAAPTIEVTIGRIEVRAVTPPPAIPPPARQRQAPPKMSLDDYLRAHGGGRS
jgi:hypothetical protein